MEQNKNDGLNGEVKIETSSVENRAKPKIAIVGLVLAMCLLLVFGASLIYIKYKDDDKKDDDIITLNLDHSIDRFESEKDFKEYLEAVNDSGYNNYWGGMSRNFALEVDGMEEQAMDTMAKADDAAVPMTGGSASDESRYSETNVQVGGVDEPDIVKTDGENIYLAKNNPVYFYDTMSCEASSDGEEKCMPTPEKPKLTTKVIDAFPVEDMKITKEIEMSGNLLLGDDILVVVGNEEIKGYDISDPSSPAEKWSFKKEDDIYFETSRLLENNLYLVARKYINRNSPCPVPLLEGDIKVEIGCGDIYHPSIPVPTNVTYSVMKIDITNGEVKAKETFVGSQGQTVVYMSKENLYVTYSYGENQFDFLYNALMDFGDKVFSGEIMNKIKKLEGYEISMQAKYTEMEKILDDYRQGLDEDDAEKIAEDLEKEMEDYIKKHKRELYTTGIVRIDLEELKVKSNGGVPGNPLNQFSLDEYEGNLRIATNIDPNIYGFGVSSGNEQSVNDVYILSDELKIKGAVKDLGKSERIYSVRFMGDKGYVVTFRQIDPFYVLDLSNPEKPEKKGELKIPGFSSYLHPLKENIILGIGQEERKLKLSMFDVSDPSDPKEVSKKIFDDWGSEAQYNHHAFLQDDKYEMFFLPGGQKAYIMSYKDNKFEKLAEVKDIGANRALFINDYLYVISDYTIKVIDEKDWKEVKEFEFAEKPSYIDDPMPVEPMPMIRGGVEEPIVDDMPEPPSETDLDDNDDE